jgi:hypothetical protein
VPSAALIVRAGVAAFIGLVALQHLLRPDLPVAERFVSEYARGSTALVQVTAFLAWAAAGAGCVALAARVRSPRRLSRAVVILALGVAVAGTVLAAAFTTQTVGGELPAGVQRTTAGRLHDFGTLLILSGLLIGALASLRLLATWRYRFAVAGLAVVLLAIVPVLVALGIDAPGIGQRGFILVGCTWQLVFARASLTARHASLG